MTQSPKSEYFFRYNIKHILHKLKRLLPNLFKNHVKLQKWTLSVI